MRGNNMLRSVLTLALVCAVVAGVLALVNNITEPVITAAKAAGADAAKLEVLPEARGFTQLEIEPLPASVTEIFEATNGVGYVMMLETQGFGGTMKLAIGLDPDGLITGVMTLEHKETAGIGAKTAESDFRSQFIGKDSALDGVSAISGASMSSRAYLGAVRDAFDAFILLSGGEIEIKPDENPIGLTDEKLAAYYPNVSEFTPVTAGTTEALRCGDDGYVVYKKRSGFDGSIIVAVMFDRDDNILGIVIDEMNDTHVVAMQCADPDFTGQFVGVSSGEEVSAISGATETSNAIKKAVDAAIASLPEVKATN